MELTKIEHLKHVDTKAMEQLLAQVQLIPRIEAYLEDMNQKEHPKGLGTFGASDLGHKSGFSLCGKYAIGCARMLYYRYIGVKAQDQVNPRLRRIYDTGHAIHHQLQRYMRDIARKTKSDVFSDEVYVDAKTSELAEEYEISSTTDGLWTINIPNMKLRFGLEIKSVNDNGFGKLSGPENHHVTQATVYMACLDLPLMVMLYYNKNDSALAEFIVKFNPKVWKAVTDKIDYVREHAINRQEPKREEGFHCRSCRYAYICKPRITKKEDFSKTRAKFRLTGV